MVAVAAAVALSRQGTGPRRGPGTRPLPVVSISVPIPVSLSISISISVSVATAVPIPLAVSLSLAVSKLLLFSPPLRHPSHASPKLLELWRGIKTASFIASTVRQNLKPPARKNRKRVGCGSDARKTISASIIIIKNKKVNQLILRNIFKVNIFFEKIILFI